MVAEEGNENPSKVNEVEAENLGPVTDSMRADAVLDANQADLEEHNSGVVISKPNTQLLLNDMPN